LSVLETRSDVAADVDELVTSVAAQRAELADVCRRHGALLAAAGTHPFARTHGQPYVPTEHYQWIKQHHRYISDRLLAFGLHVHVGMPSAPAAIYTMNELRRWAYPLLALSANSPFFEGGDTGLASARWHLFSCMPRTGVAPQFESMTELVDLYEKLLAAGDITQPGDLWWIIRPQPPLGTVEFRIFDMPTDVQRIGTLAAICQAACAHYCRQFSAGQPPTDLNDAWIDQNRWKAMRYDPDAKIVDPADGQVLTIRRQLHRLLEMIAPQGASLGSVEWLVAAAERVDGPTESQRQVRRAEQLGGNLRALELEIAAETVQSCVLEP